MHAGHSVLPFGLDPLIAEAKRRMRRRRALSVVLGLAVIGTALGIALAMRGPSAPVISVHSHSGSAPPRGEKIGPGPFVGFGAIFDTNGFKGDLNPARKQASLGCLDGRHFADAFGIENRWDVPVTLLAAPGWSSPAGNVERVATQFHLSPPYHPTGGSTVAIGPVIRHDWSAAPTRPLTIPPGRVATVQSNFVFRHCGRLAHGRSVAVPGSLVVRYRASGRVRQKVVPMTSFSLIAGPTRRTCAPFSGALSVFSSDTSCAATRRAALACHPLSHGSWGYCTSAKVLWDCGRMATRHGSYFETCNLVPQDLRGHWFRVRWKASHA